MNDSYAVGVLGGYGAVGRAAVAQLEAWGAGSVLVAGRDPARARMVVDLADRAALERFCARVRVVVNCAGPSSEVLDRVARAALATGAQYVDAGGDDPVHALLSGAGAGSGSGLGASTRGGDRAAVLSAGMLPGLTGLLPRALAAGRASRLTGYVGGQDRFTRTGAIDYLASLSNGFGRSNVAWRNGHRTTVTPLADAELPYFPGPAVAYPYLSTEMERLARHLGAAELTFYNVFPGAHLRAALATAGAHAGTPAGTDWGATAGGDADALVTASELDLFGREPYQRLVFQVQDGEAGGGDTLVLSGLGASQLTGATVALATTAVLAGAVPPGVHFAADVLDPAWAVDRLRTAQAVQALEVFTAADDAELVEDGVL